MNIYCKPFTELKPLELFSVYQLRSRVFVVEQNCAYQDVDEKDLTALHVLLMEEEKLLAYARILPPGISYTQASIGRVVVRPEYRGKGYAKKLMTFCMARIVNLFPESGIKLSAQSYLLKFYQDFGFTTVGKEYQEDGIPHREMLFNPDQREI